MICEDFIAITIAFIIIALWSANWVFSASIFGAIARVAVKTLVVIGVERLANTLAKEAIEATVNFSRINRLIANNTHQ